MKSQKTWQDKRQLLIDMLVLVICLLLMTAERWVRL